MEPANETFIISTQKDLLHNNKPKQTKFKNSKSTTIFFLLMLFIVIATLSPSRYIKNQRPEQPYLSGPSRYYYCHLTLYPDLCYGSMSIINTTLKPNPRLIFSDSLQLAINELNNTAITINKSLSSFISSSPLAGPRLSICQKTVHDSLRLLNEPLGFDSNVKSLTYEETNDLMAWGKAALNDVGKCCLVLEEIDDMAVAMGGGHEKMMGVEEVKVGVEKAKRLIENFIGLFDSRESILDDFYSPSLEMDYEYSYDYNFLIGYRFVIGMYSFMYLLLAFLYFLMWSIIG